MKYKSSEKNDMYSQLEIITFLASIFLMGVSTMSLCLIATVL